MSVQSEELKQRTMSFAVNILRIVDMLPPTISAQIVGRQLAKAATSVGANYRAVCTARSDNEFIAKLCTVNEEADESVYWLELLERATLASPEILRSSLSEALELRAIFGRSLKTARWRRKARIASPNDQMTN